MQTIRAATADDLHVIADMHVRSWQRGFAAFIAADLLPATDVTDRHAFWAAHLPRPAALTLVAETTAGIVGACAIEMPSATAGSRQESAAVEIMALYVDPDAWRTGTGRSLLAAARPIVRSRGHRRWALWTLSTHAPTRAFYDREGFIPDPHQHQQHDWGAPLVRLGADLRPPATGPA